MIHALNSLLAPALMERLTLVVNHVLASEPVATQRLAPHAGRCLRLDLQGWPTLLPPPPPLAFRVTPAGLVEWCSEPGADTADLLVRIDASNPAALALRAAGGQWPAVDIQGDSQLAADVDWLLKNLRWDVAADLERLFPPAVAHELHRMGSALARGLHAAVEQAGALAGRWRSGDGR